MSTTRKRVERKRHSDSRQLNQVQHVFAVARTKAQEGFGGSKAGR
jgi:hypothetical protein